MKETSNITIALEMARDYSRSADEASFTDAYDTSRENRIRALMLARLVATTRHHVLRLSDIESAIHDKRVESKGWKNEQERQRLNEELYALEQLLDRFRGELW
jgi:hypothetical protein